jgi:hypothetical protein
MREKMSAVRKLGASHSLQDLKAAVENSKEFNLGILPMYKVRELENLATELELTLQLIDRAITQYLPFHPETQSALILDTPAAVTQQIIQNMLDAGVPIVNHPDVD